MKRAPRLSEIYRGIRKPTAPPTRVEKDLREKIRGREDKKDIDRHTGSRRPTDNGRED
ncbi:MAG TPA: hypothetical protein VIK22_09810 [Candidatus Anoxymicrobiaceae bacterium]